MPGVRHPTPEPPAEIGTHDGLAYSLWLPRSEPKGGVLVLHGAGSSKESHHDFARACRTAGLAALCFDQRGHGASEGAMGEGVLDDLRAMAERLGARPLALRGSSMGGYLALVAAGPLDAAAVVAICPAGSEHLLSGLRDERFDFRADREGLGRFLGAHDAGRAVEQLEAPLLLLHAEGDEQIPVAHSRALHARATRSAEAKLVALPGGHHRSVQHDAEMQGVALRFIVRAFRRARA
jgi:pimeloyl-ACP methyl ester carboxylesterase